MMKENNVIMKINKVSWSALNGWKKEARGGRTNKKTEEEALNRQNIRSHRDVTKTIELRLSKPKPREINWFTERRCCLSHCSSSSDFNLANDRVTPRRDAVTAPLLRDTDRQRGRKTHRQRQRERQTKTQAEV